MRAACRGAAMFERSLIFQRVSYVAPRLGVMSERCACTRGCLRAIPLSPLIRIYSAVVGSLLSHLAQHGWWPVRPCEFGGMRARVWAANQKNTKNTNALIVDFSF